MQGYQIGDFCVEYDKPVTADWYQQFEGWTCDCEDCQNFIALAKDKQLPPAVLDLLTVFGAQPEKPTYVCELSPTEHGHLYQFNYRVAGRLRNNPHPNDSVRFDWGSVCCGHEDYPCGAPDFPKPHFDLMFFVDLPWILDKSSAPLSFCV